MRDFRIEKNIFNFPFLLILLIFRFSLDFILLHIVKVEFARFPTVVWKLDKAFEKSFKKKKFTLITPDLLKLVVYGYKEARFVSFLIFEIYWRKIYEQYRIDYKSPLVTIFDVGANMGTFTLKLAKRIQNNGVVVAIEPFPYNFTRLQDNIRLNSLKNIIVLGVALGEMKGTVPLWLPPKNEENTGTASTRFEISDRFVQVPVLTLNDVMKELKIPSINLLKLDAEGSELSILKGSAGSIRNIQSMAIAAEHFPEQANELSKFLSDSKFNVRIKVQGGHPYVYAEVKRGDSAKI
jgi:FkbM family methyltransferase